MLCWVSKVRTRSRVTAQPAQSLRQETRSFTSRQVKLRISLRVQDHPEDVLQGPSSTILRKYELTSTTIRFGWSWTLRDMQNNTWGPGGPAAPKPLREGGHHEGSWVAWEKAPTTSCLDQTISLVAGSSGVETRPTEVEEPNFDYIP